MQFPIHRIQIRDTPLALSSAKSLFHLCFSVQKSWKHETVAKFFWEFSTGSQDEVGCVSSGLNSRALDNEEEATSSSALPRPTKRQRAAAAAVETNPMATSGGGGGGRVGGAESLMSALKRLLRRSAAAGNAAAAVSGICRLSGYHQSR